MIRRGRRGSLATFFCLVLAGTMMILLILLHAAQDRSAEHDLDRALNAQIQASLAGFDRSWREFGLFGFLPGTTDSSVFQAMLPKQMKSCRLQVELQRPLADPIELDRQIVRYMKARVPALYLARLAGQLTRSAGGASGGLQAEGVREFCSLTESSVRAAAGSLFGSLLDELQNQALSLLKENYQQYASEFLGARSDDQIPAILGEMPDFLDPQSITRMAGTIEGLLDFKTAPLYEKCCLVEYVLDQFRPSVQQMISSAGREELKTIDGRFFSSMPDSREAEAEQILTGLEKPADARLAVRALTTALRSMIHLAALLSDPERMEAIRVSATGTSVFIAVLTAGQIIIEPQVMTYLLTAGQAISAGMSDYERLSSGCAVEFWPTRGKLAIPSFYQDYLRLFLLFVPRSTILERVAAKLEELLPGPCYAGLQLSVNYQNRTYRRGGGYQ